MIVGWGAASYFCSDNHGSSLANACKTGPTHTWPLLQLDDGQKEAIVNGDAATYQLIYSQCFCANLLVKLPGGQKQSFQMLPRDNFDTERTWCAEMNAPRQSASFGMSNWFGPCLNMFKPLLSTIHPLSFPVPGGFVHGDFAARGLTQATRLGLARGGERFGPLRAPGAPWTARWAGHVSPRPGWFTNWMGFGLGVGV